MIQSLIKWDHSTEWSVADFSGKVCVSFTPGIIIIIINILTSINRTEECQLFALVGNLWCP